MVEAVIFELLLVEAEQLARGEFLLVVAGVWLDWSLCVPWLGGGIGAALVAIVEFVWFGCSVVVVSVDDE